MRWGLARSGGRCCDGFVRPCLGPEAGKFFAPRHLAECVLQSVAGRESKLEHERIAVDRAESAVVSVLAPICVEKFQQQANSAAKLIEFKKAASWDQRALIEKGGWATTPGAEKMNSAVASACVDKLGRLS